MTHTQVQRTLVKSAPELWAELSDPASLARHLGELGEIRITRVQPEREIAWEAPEATGTVQIKSSGWGTRVTLTLNRSPAGSEPQPAEPSVPSEPVATLPPITPSGPDALPAEEPEELAPGPPEPILDTEPVAAEGPEPVAEQELALAEPEPEYDPAPAEELVGEAPLAHTLAELLPRRGFFVRLLERFRGHQQEAPHTAAPDPFQGLALVTTHASTWAASSRMRKEPEQLDPEPPGPPALEIPLPATEPLPDEPASREQEVIEAAPAGAPTDAADEAIESVGPVAPESVAPDTPESVAPVALESASPVTPESAAPDTPESASPVTPESAARDDDAAVLASVLDRLGAAHHRPFSRA